MTRPRAGGSTGPSWTAGSARRLLEPNPLWASNGVAFGPDGRLHVAQFLGGTVSALDTATGELDVVLGPDGPLTAPDDLVFDDVGNLYVVDLPAGLVWRRAPDGTLSIVADGIVAPDGIAWHRGRLFVNELTVDGRLLEIDLDGGPPRTMATGLMLGNAMQVGPDGLLYYPHLGGGEVWRIGLDGGAPERVIAGLDRPVAVRFDPAGLLRVLSNADGRLWTVARGEVAGTVETGAVGADNVAFDADGTAWVSGAFRGGIRAVTPDGAVRTVLPEGLNGPFGVAATGDGTLVAADYFGLVRIGPDREPEHAGDVVSAVGGGVIGVCSRGAAEIALVTDTGAVVTGAPWSGGLRPLAHGLTRPTGVADADDGVLVADTGAGTVVHVGDDGAVSGRATGLDRPSGVAVGAGRAYVTETGRGRIVRVEDGAVVAAGLQRPEGLAADGDVLWCAEAGTGRVLRVDAARRTSTVVASGLAFDVRPDHVPPDVRSGMGRRPAPFAGLTRDGDALVVAQNAEGALLRLSGLTGG